MGKFCKARMLMPPWSLGGDWSREMAGKALNTISSQFLFHIKKTRTMGVADWLEPPGLVAWTALSWLEVVYCASGDCVLGLRIPAASAKYVRYPSQDNGPQSGLLSH